MTRLCVSIFVSSVEQARRDIAAAVEAGADVIELRVDRVTDGPVPWQVMDGFDLPFIITCRPTWEGGQCELPETERLSLLDTARAQDVGYVDYELMALRRHGLPTESAAASEVIVSSHDFTGRPDRLYNLVDEMDRLAGAHVNKLAWTARTVRDNVEAFELLLNRRKPTIALCMGEAGLISRVLAKKFGAFLTFASLDAAGATAPGQVPVTDLKQMYRWDKLGPRTKVYGVVGSPVAHSMSPAIHNAAFDAAAHDGVYVPLLVNPGYESFKAFMESFLAFAPLDLCGLSVTIPHKENALRYLRETGADVEPLAERIGAVNTIIVDRSAAPDVAEGRKAEGRRQKAEPTTRRPAPGTSYRLRGRNTDYAAILDCITGGLGVERDQLRDYRVAVLGAGGTGRTAVAALAHYGASVVVYNRTRDRAQALADEFDGRPGRVVAAPLDELGGSRCRVVVNATSVGMHPHVDASPLDGHALALTPDQLVFDTIYNPPRTKLLAIAAAGGARTVGGVEMFVRQAAAQFELWTDNPAPAGVMRAVVERRLGVRA